MTTPLTPLFNLAATGLGGSSGGGSVGIANKHLAQLAELRLIESIRDEYVFDSTFDRIGSGAFSVVYKATCRNHTTHPGSSGSGSSSLAYHPYHHHCRSSSGGDGDSGEKEQVALKIIPKKRLETEKHAKDVLREARLLGIVDSKSCPKLIEAVQTKNDVILVMTLVEGVELGKVLRKTGALPEKVVSVLMKQILGTIEFLHSMDCVHRDLKPDNLLLSIPSSPQQQRRSSSSTVVAGTRGGGGLRPEEKQPQQLSEGVSRNSSPSSRSSSTEDQRKEEAPGFNLFGPPPSITATTSQPSTSSPASMSPHNRSERSRCSRIINGNNGNSNTSKSGQSSSSRVLCDVDDFTVETLTAAVMQDQHHITLVDFGFARGVSLCENKFGGLVNSCEDLSGLVSDAKTALEKSQLTASSHGTVGTSSNFSVGSGGGGGVLLLPPDNSPNTPNTSMRTTFEEQTARAVLTARQQQQVPRTPREQGKKLKDSEGAEEAPSQIARAHSGTELPSLCNRLNPTTMTSTTNQNNSSDSSEEQQAGGLPRSGGGQGNNNNQMEVAGESSSSLGESPVESNQAPLPSPSAGSSSSFAQGAGGACAMVEDEVGTVNAPFTETVFLSTCGAERFIAPELLQVMLNESSTNSSSSLGAMMMMGGTPAHGGGGIASLATGRSLRPKHTHQQTTTTGVEGTGNYSAGKKRTTTELAKKVDLYSLGVLCFVLLSGCFPFNGKTKSSLLTQTLHGAKFSSMNWNSVSAEAKTFVSLLLCPEPEKRLSALQALEHPWICATGIKEENECRGENQT